MKPGEQVVYKPDPLLYGLMVVDRIARNGKVECRSALRAKAWPKNRVEVFDAHELTEPEGTELDLGPLAPDGPPLSTAAAVEDLEIVFEPEFDLDEPDGA